ncbi:membrane protein [Streptomyces caelestis]|uniref:Membrane protein n=2 Tax=Streptomyces TaxID=1883 RepID=A0A0M8QS13_9ACTN|nr:MULTISPECIES: hypothetical protein [Streptomyces]KOT41343.1 membrane protein [Streptomyces caelestis]KOV33672.1 membrane protein [Streptomyces sp. XY152]
MTATHPTHGAGTGTGAHAPSAKRQWAEGLTVFAAVSLMIVSVLDILRGIMGIAQDDVFVTTQDYVFRFNLTAWGWTHLVLGAIGVLVSLGLARGTLWARVAGVTIAGLLVIANFLSLPYYPVWSVVMIAFSGFVIWALCAPRSRADAEH